MKKITLELNINLIELVFSYIKKKKKTEESSLYMREHV